MLAALRAVRVPLVPPAPSPLLQQARTKMGSRTPAGNFSRSAAIRTFTRARAIKSTAGCRRRARRPRLPTGVPQAHAFRAPRTVGVWVQTKLVDWQMPDLSEFPVPRRRRSPRVPAIRSSRLACAPLQLKPYVAYGADPRAKHRRRPCPIRLARDTSTGQGSTRIYLPASRVARRRYDPVKAPEG